MRKLLRKTLIYFGLHRGGYHAGRPFYGRRHLLAVKVEALVSTRWAASDAPCAIFNSNKKVCHMTRTSRQSSKAKQAYLATSTGTSYIPRRDMSLAEQIIETKLRSEQAKLSLLEAKLPDEFSPKYTRYVDMPPPTPEDEAMFQAEFAQLLDSVFAEPIGPEVGQTVQDWLREQGAVIPDTPEWAVPLYLEKWIET